MNIPKERTRNFPSAEAARSKPKNQEGLIVSNSSGASLTLFPTQVIHFQRLAAILEYYRFALDTSLMGTGKTFSTLAIAIHFGIPIFVICPKTAVPMWRKTAKDVGVQVADAMTYDTLRGRKGSGTKHKWLAREELIKDGREFMTFTPTEELIQLIKNGVMVVFDEFHYLRHISARTMACQSIIRMCHKLNNDPTSKSPNFVIALSGTPATEQDEYIRYMRFLGLIKSPMLFTTNQGKIRLLGAAELAARCGELDPNATRAVSHRRLNEDPIVDERSVISFCYDLYREVIMKFIVSEMATPSGSQLIAKNSLFLLDAFPEDKKRFEDALQGLIQALSVPNENIDQLMANPEEELEKQNPEAQPEINKKGLIEGRGNAMLQQMEISKVRSIILHAMKEKRADPRVKLIFFFSYLKSIQHAANILLNDYGYNPDDIGILTGKTKLPMRSKIIERFNTPTIYEDIDDDKLDESTRIKTNGGISILIGNLVVCSTGISLHDTVGNQPRITYCCSSSRIIDVYQSCYRTCRMGAKSFSRVFVCYATLEDPGKQKNKAEECIDINMVNIVGSEANILSRLTRRSSVFAETLLAQREDPNIKFPSEFPFQIVRPL